MVRRSSFFRPGAAGATEPAAAVGPDWMKQAPRKLSSGALLSVAVSSDGQLLAAGGGDRRVHVWDTRTASIVHSYPGHKDGITGPPPALQAQPNKAGPDSYCLGLGKS